MQEEEEEEVHPADGGSFHVVDVEAPIAGDV